MAATPQRLVLATRNPHKLKEFERLLGPIVDPLPEHIELPPETGETFTDNALPKARAAARATGRAAIADDSGIEAEALNGAPGVRSARFAGPGATDQENLDKLIEQVAPDTPLRYVCALAYVDPATETERVFIGESRGAMAPNPSGTHGFGYDPVFVPQAHDGRTMAELTDAEKDAISHRGRAARALMQWLQS
jgi:XTP/dITP diphosphohydrolase